jgi:hypothetical protein
MELSNQYIYMMKYVALMVKDEKSACGGHGKAKQSRNSIDSPSIDPCQ